MGLIKAIAGAAGGVMADQWKEFFTCEALPADVLAVKGQKKTTRRSSNTHGDENIITSGSRIAVADGQCMLIVEQGKVVEVCAEPGEYTYDASTEPTIFAGNLGESIGQVFQNIGKRFTFGGEAPKDQRIYYFNTKELTGNKYGTPSPVPFRVVDQRAGIDIDIAIRCFGEYSYRITNPLLFYTNVCGNVTEDYTRDTIDGQLKSELLTALQPAFARISDMGIRYSSLPGHTREIAEALNEELSAQWRDRRGLEIVAFGVSSVKANEEDEQMIKEMQREAAYMDPTRAAAMLSRSQGEAMKAAASNTATGPAMAFMGMGMAGQMGGINAQNLYAMGQQQAAQQAAQQPAAAPQPASAAPLTEAEQFQREGVDFLNYLKACCSRLGSDADEELVQMRKICASILGFVHNHPEQLGRVRRFREYYLPTTRKLLDTAQGLGDTDTANAAEIRRDITGILHTLNQAYAKLYDTLLQDVSMDVSTEIDTLETMLRQDGLTHDFESDFNTRS